MLVGQPPVRRAAAHTASLTLRRDLMAVAARSVFYRIFTRRRARVASVRVYRDTACKGMIRTACSIEPEIECNFGFDFWRLVIAASDF